LLSVSLSVYMCVTDVMLGDEHTWVQGATQDVSHHSGNELGA